jgi:hypothetical protein
MAINLTLIHNPRRFKVTDLGEIASAVLRREPSFLINIVAPRDLAVSVPTEGGQHPSITVAFGTSGRFIPPRAHFRVQGDQEARAIQPLLAGSIAKPRTARSCPARLMSRRSGHPT